MCSDSNTATSTRALSLPRYWRCRRTRSLCSSSPLWAARRKAASTVALVVLAPSTRLARAKSSSSTSIVVRLITHTHYQRSEYTNIAHMPTLNDTGWESTGRPCEETTRLPTHVPPIPKAMKVS